MAREKRSLFEWLTGGSGASDDYTFDDLESGGSGTYPPAPSRKLSPLRKDKE
jgi:hypothetical protein